MFAEIDEISAAIEYFGIVKDEHGGSPATRGGSIAISRSINGTASDDDERNTSWCEGSIIALVDARIKPILSELLSMKKSVLLS